MTRLRKAEAIEAIAGFTGLLFFVVYFGIHCFRYPWVGDLGRHCASVASLYRDFLHPTHEAMLVPGTDSEVHTPYIVAAAAMGRALGVTPYRALQIAGVFNLAFYAWAIWFFFRTSSLVKSWIPPVAFLIISLFLRSRLFYWSSETSFASVRWIQAYPSFFAWGAALTVFALVERALRRPRTLLLLPIALLIWTVLLSHNLTGSWVIGIVGLRGSFELFATRSGWRRALPLYAAVAAGVALTLSWPYFDITGSAGFLQIGEASAFGDHPFADMAGLYALALPAAIGFLLFRKHTFWIAAFAATWLALQVFRFLGSDFGNRYAFFQAFFAQAAVAEVVGLALILALRQRPRLAEEIEIGPRLRIGILLLGAGALVLTATAPVARQEWRAGRPLLGLGELMARPSTHDAYYRQLGAVGQRLGPADLVLMPVEHAAWDVASITGAHVVASLVAYRVPDFARRVSDVERFFTAGVPPREREEILRRYRVSKVLLTPRVLGRADELTAQLGPALARTESLLLLEANRER